MTELDGFTTTYVLQYRNGSGRWVTSCSYPAVSRERAIQHCKDLKKADQFSWRMLRKDVRYLEVDLDA